MADIFLSYASEDRDRAQQVAEALEAQGWSVFWDRRILPGKTWWEAVEQELAAARTTVVLWSRHSVASRWIIQEASAAVQRDALIPVLIEDVVPPVQFRQLECGNLVGWSGDLRDRNLRVVLLAIGYRLAEEPASAPAVPRDLPSIEEEAEADLQGQITALRRELAEVSAMFKKAEEQRLAAEREMHQIRRELEARQGKSRDVFLNYRREDSRQLTERIADWLVRHFGSDSVFIDVDAIPPGVQYRAYLDEQVSGCAVFLCIIGRDWLSIEDEDGARRLDDENDFVRIEIEAALARNVPFVPVLLQSAAIPEEAELPESLRPLNGFQALPVRLNPDFKGDVERLIRRLEELLPEGES